MANEIKWSATLGSFTTLIAGVTATPTLKNLADNAVVVGNAISGNRHQYAGLELKCRFQASPNSYGVIEVYLVPDISGSQYLDGAGSSVIPPATLRVASLPLRAVTTQQFTGEVLINLPPFNFVPVVVNKSGAAMTNTDNENILSYRPFNSEVQ